MTELIELMAREGEATQETVLSGITLPTVTTTTNPSNISSSRVVVPSKKRAIEVSGEGGGAGGESSFLSKRHVSQPSVNPRNRKGGKAWSNDNDPNLDEKIKLKNGEYSFMYKGLYPVYKYGYDKFAFPYFNDSDEFEFYMGDFKMNKESNEWEPDDLKKNVRLNEKQLMRLASNILSGSTEIYRDARASADNENLSAYLSLSGDFYFVWTTFYKKPMASLRRIVETRTGDLIPTPEGITMSATTWDAFRQQILDGSLLEYASNVIIQHRLKNGKSVISKEALAMGGDFEELMRTVENVYLESIKDFHTSKCEKCVDMRLIYDAPKRRDPAHTCHWGISKLPLPYTVKKETAKRLLVSHKVLGKHSLSKLLFHIILEPYCLQGCACTFAHGVKKPGLPKL